MKIRLSFIGNSSSSSFLIKNRTTLTLTAKDFAEEVSYLVEEFNKSYGCTYTEKEFIEASKNYPTYIWKPEEEKLVSFGDHDQNPMGNILDYALRDFDNGTTTSFEWRFDHHER